MLGGKGANQAVGLAQLGMRPALVGVVGDDDVGWDVLGQARRDGIDVSCVVRREGAETGLIVDIVDGDGRWRYLEDTPPPVLLTGDDVAAAGPLLRDAPWAAVQLQQPPEAVRAAVDLARGNRIVLDGAPSEDDRDDLLAAAFLVRADAREAGMLAGAPLGSADEAVRLGADLMRRGPSLVALAVEDANVFVWEGGHTVVPLDDTPVADTTGAGDALTAGLIAALARGEPPERAARFAVAAAGATVGHPGGRPALDRDRVAARAGL
ncbi:bifunctional hydroxymethylpyrimidine kinase/phosphomethylpyrimidine kinase [Actinomadura sp. LCR2-06]|uniref:Bifunctional hydroxymethylpyrimidine kinase/phosphomethylpyrimidine kinase n=1 Tax=Actinomadura violacea TaxID=2819934 RepID=A0ABS3S720_9ACTN|nr:bifunctional hydroxymethylpyrimidine kinase/phosphomethylpyrimidine kinase [Actinomadura violacea]